MQRYCPETPGSTDTDLDQPENGVQGHSVAVTLTGTNFVAGATIGVSGTGITVSSTTVVSATQITATLTIAANAATGAQNITVTTSGGTSGAQPFMVNPVGAPPTLTSINPNSGVQGQDVAVTLTGTNFVAGATVGVSGAGITVSNTTVVSATQITATLTIAANAATGAQNVTVTSLGSVTTVVTFTVNPVRSPPTPTLTSISPNSGVQGQSVPVTLTGTNFVAGATIGVSGAGITVSNTTVVTATQITATLTIAANAATGAQNITVTTSGGTSGEQPFTVNLAPPTLTSINSNSGVQGQGVAVTLTGTNFIAGATIGVSGAGITVSNTTVASATQITATLTIAANAATGARNITVTTSGGTSSPQIFTVNLAPPTLTSISPNSGVQGQSVPVTLTGTNFVAGATIGLSGAGITVSNTTVASATQITATLTIAANAATGARNVTVTTSGGTSGAQPFTVNLDPPTLTSISPNSGVQGQSVPVTLTGTNFVAGATIGVSGAGITVSSTTVASATQITATFAIASNAATGAQNVTVTTSGGTSGAQPFIVDLLVPTLSSTNPVNGAIVVPTNREITATFSKAMTALTTATFTLSGGGTSVVGTVNYDATNNTAIFKPMNPLAASTTYTATIAATATDSAGNPLASNGMAPDPWTFTTGTTTDTTSPTVSAVYPAANNAGVLLNQKITVTFSEAMDSSTLTAATFTVKQGVAVVAGSVSYAGTTATFTPASPLIANSPYNLSITAGAKDLAGNGVTSGGLSPNPWTFTTISASDNAATTVSLTSPAQGITAAAVDATVNAVFSQGMDPATITTATFTVTGPGTTPVNGAVSYDATSNVATFTPASNLSPTVVYTATITNGAQDLEGKPLASGGLAPNPWTFTAGATTQSPAPVNLGSAASYAILAGSTVTNSGATFINGDLGLSPGTAVTGFGPGIENGTARVSPDANAASAESDLTAAFNDVAGRTTNQIVQPTGELGGLILAPGLYKAPAPGSFAISTGDLTLDAQGNSSAVWIFQMPSSTLTVGSGLQVILINGAKASNVFWQVGSSATVGGTLFRGNILASASITLQTGAMVDGRVLTQVAAVTLVTNTVTKPGP
jgi:Ice-binding-like/Bacterial Ig-like domain/IPT/TIG domain